MFYTKNLHFWSFRAKYCHFLHILSNARPKTNLNKVPRWVFRYVGNKTFDFSSKKRIFCSKTTKFSPKLAFLTIAISFGALLMGWLVVVARGLYLARHLFTLYHSGLFYTMIVLSEYCPKKKKRRAISSCGVTAQSGEAEFVRSNRRGGKTGVGRAAQKWRKEPLCGLRTRPPRFCARPLAKKDLI